MLGDGKLSRGHRELVAALRSDRRAQQLLSLSTRRAEIPAAGHSSPQAGFPRYERRTVLARPPCPLNRSVSTIKFLTQTRDTFRYVRETQRGGAGRERKEEGGEGETEMDGRSLKAIEKHREVQMGERSTEQRGQTDETTGERRRERARSRQIDRERKKEIRDDPQRKDICAENPGVLGG